MKQLIKDFNLLRSKSHEKPIHILYFILSYFLRNKQNTIFVLEKYPKILNLRKSIHHEFDDFLQFFKFLLPYKGLMGTCGQLGYVFRDFCLKQGIDFINFCLKQDKCLKQGIKNRNSVLSRVGKSAIFVLNKVRV